MNGVAFRHPVLVVEIKGHMHNSLQHRINILAMRVEKSPRPLATSFLCWKWRADFKEWHSPANLFFIRPPHFCVEATIDGCIIDNPNGMLRSYARIHGNV